MIHWVSDYFKSLRSKIEQCTGDAWTHGDGRLLHQLTRLRPGAQAKLLMASSSTTTMTTWAAQAKATSPHRRPKYRVFQEAYLICQMLFSVREIEVDSDINLII